MLSCVSHLTLTKRMITKGYNILVKSIQFSNHKTSTIVGFAMTKLTKNKSNSPNLALITRLLEVIEHEIAPLTAGQVQLGNKIFGAALLRKSDLSTILVETNNETENPLWHGEIHAIKRYYELVNADEKFRVQQSEQIFLSTHEPCTLCSSAIAWAGYDNFYYLFSHEESRDSFAIGHDLNILKEIFSLEPGMYNRCNSYWTAHSIVDLVADCGLEKKQDYEAQIQRIRNLYSDMSNTYQSIKSHSKNIPLK